MVRPPQLALLLLAAFAPAVGLAQSNGQTSGQTPSASPAPCTVAPQPAPCSSAPATKPSAAERFPFPGETPDTPVSPVPSTPGPSAAQAPGASAPDAPGTTTPAKKNSGADFPFPGDDPGTSSSSSSSSSSSADNPFPGDTDTDPDKPALKDKGSEGATTPPSGRRLLKRVNPIGTKLQTDDEREAEDLNVAHYYTQSGDIPGAYLRAKDAVKTIPDDPDAHFALAEAARRMNKKDEAVAEYNACLKLDPDEKEAANARKELAKLK